MSSSSSTSTRTGSGVAELRQLREKMFLTYDEFRDTPIIQAHLINARLLVGNAIYEVSQSTDPYTPARRRRLRGLDGIVPPMSDAPGAEGGETGPLTVQMIDRYCEKMDELVYLLKKEFIFYTHQYPSFNWGISYMERAVQELVLSKGHANWMLGTMLRRQVSIVTELVTPMEDDEFSM